MMRTPPGLRARWKTSVISRADSVLTSTHREDDHVPAPIPKVKPSISLMSGLKCTPSFQAVS
jgi:hypothetical protein